MRPPRIALAFAWTTLALVKTGCTAPSPPAPSPPAAASTASAGQPRVESAEPTADDYAVLIQGLGIHPKAWIYDGPRTHVRFAVEVQDTDKPDSRTDATMAVEDGARIVFALVPPDGPNGQTRSHLAVSFDGAQSSATATFPRLWNGWQGTVSTSISSQSALDLGDDPKAPQATLHEIKAELFEPAAAGDAPAEDSPLRPARTVIVRLRAVIAPETTSAPETPQPKPE